MFGSKTKFEQLLNSLSNRLSVTQDGMNTDRRIYEKRLRDLMDRVSFLEAENARIKEYLEIEFVKVPATYKAVSTDNSD